MPPFKHMIKCFYLYTAKSKTIWLRFSSSFKVKSSLRNNPFRGEKKGCLQQYSIDNPIPILKGNLLGTISSSSTAHLFLWLVNKMSESLTISTEAYNIFIKYFCLHGFHMRILNQIQKNQHRCRDRDIWWLKFSFPLFIRVRQKQTETRNYCLRTTCCICLPLSSTRFLFLKSCLLFSSFIGDLSTSPEMLPVTHHLHFIEEETEAQRGLTQPGKRSHESGRQDLKAPSLLAGP